MTENTQINDISNPSLPFNNNLNISKNKLNDSKIDQEVIENNQEIIEKKPKFINKVLRVFNQAPYFENLAWDGEKIKTISLSDYKGKWLVLFFYPLDFSFVCPTEICGLNDLYDSFTSLNCEILCVSCDSEYSHKYFSKKPKNKGGLFPCRISLLSDMNKSISLDYGILYDSGINEGVSQRATFIIDDKNIIRSIDINDSPVGRNIELILKRVKDLQGVKEE